MQVIWDAVNVPELSTQAVFSLTSTPTEYDGWCAAGVGLQGWGPVAPSRQSVGCKITRRAWGLGQPHEG